MMDTYDITDADVDVIRECLKASASAVAAEALKRFKPTCRTDQRLVMTGETVFEAFAGDQRLDSLNTDEVEEFLGDAWVYDAWYEACEAAVEEAYEAKKERV